MCGIVGYTGAKKAIPILIEGLEQLEYRGYDSAGIACLEKGGVFVVKEKGKLAALKEALRGREFSSRAGIGHTRWATHGVPSRDNAHPHTDQSGRIALVHNGIIENYGELKKELQGQGCRFRSQTDTEVAANLIGQYYAKANDFLAAFLKAVVRLKGFFSFVVICKDEPGNLLVFRRSNPIVIGLGKGENFVASDVSALLAHTQTVIYLEDDEYAKVGPEQVQIFSLKTHKQVFRSAVKIRWNVSQARKDGYPHFMLKEINEQPRILEELISKRLAPGGHIQFDTLDKKIVRRLRIIRKVFFISCGTAYHAGVIGSKMMEEWARLPAKADVSSEFRYGSPVVSKEDLVVLITQSGETADTLAALREAKSRGACTLAIVNVIGSSIAREADVVIYTHAGPEIGVASTKAYTAQLLTLIFFTIYMARLRKVIDSKTLRVLCGEIYNLPRYCEQVLRQSSVVEKIAKKYYRSPNFLYLGRGYHFATALEGALKLKEVSYAHAHGYAAGEMKHGPIALIDSRQPVICIAPAAKRHDKMISNIEEIKARGGIILGVATAGDREVKRLTKEVFWIPEIPEILSPVVAVLPLQVFAYKVAVLNGRDVDQPRNLAKSVTVE